MQHVTYAASDGIAVISLDRPDRLNAFTDHMEAGLVECFDRADADDDVRVVVLTGSGRAFCAGMDLSEAPDGKAFQHWRTADTAPPGTTFDVPGEDLPVRRDGGGRVVLRMFDSAKPVIAAINGHAVGVGITMTLAADVRVMATGAKIAFPFTRRAFVPESCSSWFLPRLVGVSTALEWMLSGRTFLSDEAFAAGLVRSLHAPEDVLPEAMRIARDIADQASPVSASLTRRMVWHMMTVDHPMTAHQIETNLLNARGVSDDADEGVAAFLENRAPVFTDRVSTHTPPADLASPGYEPPRGAAPR